MDDKSFIREKIEKKPISRRERLKKGLYLVGGAVLFGVVAGLSFAVTSMRTTNALRPPETIETLSVPRDEFPEESTSEAPPAETTMSDGTEESTEPLSLGVAEYQMLHESIVDVINQVKKGLVTVTTVQRKVDWFNQEYTTEGKVAGAITAITSKELLILFRGDALKNSDGLQITFWEGTSLPASIKSTDSVTGIAIAAVELSEVKDTLLNQVNELVLGNSYRTRLGEQVIAGGSPYGSIGSIAVGTVVYIMDDMQWVDGSIRVIYTDMGLPDSAGGFVFNLKGEVIGMFTRDFSGSENSLSQVLSISNLKPVLEHMYNGTAMGTLGIKGSTVTEKISNEEDMPRGVYVTEIVEGSPAFEAGLQYGDVITGLEGEQLYSLKELQNFLEKPLPEKEVSFTVMRSGVTEWKEVSFSIQLESRQR